MITTFGDNEFKATVEYKGGTRETHMHEGIYYDNLAPDKKPFTNYVFNEDKQKGESDAIEMAQEFVRSREVKYGK